MTQLVDYLSKPRPLAAIPLTLAALYFMIVLFPAAARNHGLPKNPVVALQMAFTKERFERALVSWGPQPENAAALVKREIIVKLDSFFPAIYGLALTLSFASISRRRPPTRGDWCSCWHQLPLPCSTTQRT